MGPFALAQRMLREVVRRDLGGSQDVGREAQLLTDGFNDMRGWNGNELEELFALLEALAHLALIRIHVIENLTHVSILFGVPRSVVHYTADFRVKAFALEHL